MKASEVISRAWEMVGDIAVTKRNPLAQMIGMANDGIKDLIFRRPQTVLTAEGSINSMFDDITTTNYATDDLPVDPSYKEALAHYIAYRIFEIDANDEKNAAQSVRHYTQYRQTT